ncbi:MAG TPA: ATP-dependent helicase [Saprospiraceae bacterium]|nr:ATP-dependent helicase [Saprospiraceae bacterium]
MDSVQASLSSLNPLQREAVISEAKRILVLAGAGSGKTKTLLQKIIYLIEEKGVSPSSILAITFTKNAANEMIDRLILSADRSEEYENIIYDKKTNQREKDFKRQGFLKKFKWINGLTIKTFHSFCYSVLRNHGVHEFDNKFRIIGDEKQREEDEFMKYTAAETVHEVINKQLIKLCEDAEYLLKLWRYILDYYVDKIHKKTLSTYTSAERNPYTTFNGTKVKSKSEQLIADWLYRHDIKFEYEPALNVKDFPFRPDFYLPDANLYIEHVSNVSYPIVDKERQFQKGGLSIVKTFETEIRDTAHFQLVLEKLIRGHLPQKQLQLRNVNFKEVFNANLYAVNEFLRHVNNIIDMIKVENIDIIQVEENASKDQHERVRIFYELAIPLVKSYNAYCINRSYLDFNDLILRCISLFHNDEEIIQGFRQKYQYILVDEFQDVNNLQVELIKLLLTDQTQLFCVGDDWQSIYGFRGSNVSYTIDFEKHFPEAKSFKLNLNYRSTQHIVGASNEVIKHNKFKVEKDIIASKQSEHKIVVYAGNTEQENLDFCVNTVKELIEQGMNPEEILFLYRRTNMYRGTYGTNGDGYSNTFYKKGLKIQAKTIHAAKGLEAKVVFILGLTDGSGGFPDVWMEDRIFQIIKKTNRDLLLEEERRLFYVAITRAKDKLYLITEKGNESSFLKEIPEIYTVKTSEPISPLVEKIPLCQKCFSQLQNLWIVCPYCGEPVV